MIRNFLKSGFILLVVATTACSKSSSNNAQQEELTGLLPADTVFYAVADCQNSDFRSWLQSPNYKKYLELTESSLKKNSPSIGDFGTYLETMKALGFMPTAPTDPIMPYEKAMYFATVGQDKSVGLGGYYNTASGENGKSILAKVKQVLSTKGIVVTDFDGQGFSGFSFDPFAGITDAEISAGFKFYRESLKINAVFLGANDSRLVIATTRPLLDRGFSPGKNEAAALVDGELTKRTLKAAGVSSNPPTFAVFDIQKIFKQSGAQESDLALLPTSIVALNTAMSGKGLTMDLAGLVEPRNDQQKEIVASIPAPSKSGLFVKLPLATAFAFSFDGPFIRMIIDNAQKMGSLPAVGPMADVLAKLEGVNIGVAASNGQTAIPDISITFISSDAKGLLEQVKGLSEMAPPGTVAWQPTVIEGVNGYSIPTPLTRIQLVAVDNVLVASTNGEVVSSIVRKNSGNDLHEAAVIEASSKNVKGPFFGVYIDYGQFAALLENSLKSAAAFLPPDQALPTEQLDAMKVLGKIAFSFGYEPGIARMSLSQEFPKIQ